MSQAAAKHVVRHLAPPTPNARHYASGFLICLVLTSAAFMAAAGKLGGTKTAIGVIAGLALLQFVVQLVKFLHIGQEFRPRWKLAVFVLMVSVVLIIVAGSIWIMSSLNYRMMQSPDAINRYVQGQDGL